MKKLNNEIIKLLNNPNDKKIAKLLNYHPMDIAATLELHTKEERLKIYDLLDISLVGLIFTYYKNISYYIEELDYLLASFVLNNLDNNILLELKNNLSEEYLENVSKYFDFTKINDYIYEENQIGYYKSNNYIKINKNSTIKQATKALIQKASSYDNIYTIYVEDDNKKYCGAIVFKELICARENDSLEDLIIKNYPKVNHLSDVSDVINTIKDYKDDSICVVDNDNKILGIITKSSIIEIVDDLSSDKYNMLAGVSDTESIDEPYLKSVRRRIPWLVLLLFLGVIVSTVVSSFEQIIKVIPCIVFFQSMLLDMSGNVSTQALASTILTLDKNKKNFKKNLFKEIKIGIINATILGIIAFLFVFIYLAIKKQEILPNFGFDIKYVLLTSFVIFISMLIAITISNFIGVLFPFIIHKLKKDPAIASGPFITTLNDIITLCIYYSLSYLFLISLL